MLIFFIFFQVCKNLEGRQRDEDRRKQQLAYLATPTRREARPTQDEEAPGALLRVPRRRWRGQWLRHLLWHPL